jgi:DNA polymerase-3 subunit chi
LRRIGVVTEIAFHFNVPDRTLHACRVVRKALAQGHRLVVTAAEGQLAHFDHMLWSFSPTEFLAHCNADADSALVAASPVVLATDLTKGLPYRELLVNLGNGVPEGFGQFGRLVEIVAADDAVDRQSARLRWKHYSDRGYPITRHDLAGAA